MNITEKQTHVSNSDNDNPLRYRMPRGQNGIISPKSGHYSLEATRGWLGPGGLPGLQNRWRVALRAAVGSTPIHSRLVFQFLLKIIKIKV